MKSTDDIDVLEDNALSSDDAALPARLSYLTPPEQLDSVIAELGPAAVRPILEEGHGLCEAAAELRDDGPWWALLSDLLEELCRYKVRDGWEVLFHAIKQAEANQPPELDQLVCTVDSILSHPDA